MFYIRNEETFINSLPYKFDHFLPAYGQIYRMISLVELYFIMYKRKRHFRHYMHNIQNIIETDELQASSWGR